MTDEERRQWNMQVQREAQNNLSAMALGEVLHALHPFVPETQDRILRAAAILLGLDKEEAR
jgi:hypothetical protein